VFEARNLAGAPAQRGLPLRPTFGYLHPLENNVVASMKHCSILAFIVVCSAQSGGKEKGSGRGLVRKGVEESDVCDGS
jgi:hypothetical protein